MSRTLSKKEIQLVNLAKDIVKKNIKGTRKGLKMPNYEHSFNVFEILQENNFGFDVCLAGLLHDIVEDSDINFQDLKNFGFQNRVLVLVRLCTHDKNIKNKDARWIKMVSGLVDADDKEAFSIKLADILDNLRHCHSLREDRREFMDKVKRIILLNITKDDLENTKLWKDVKNCAVRNKKFLFF